MFISYPRCARRRALAVANGDAPQPCEAHETSDERPSTKLLKMKRTSKVIMVLVSVALLLWIGFWLRRQLSIDSCLDHGGSWNYVISQCENS